MLRTLYRSLMEPIGKTFLFRGSEQLLKGFGGFI